MYQKLNIRYLGAKNPFRSSRGIFHLFMYCSHVYHYKTVHIMMEENSLPANSGYTFFILCNRNRIIYPLARTHPEKKHHHSMHIKKKKCYSSSVWEAWTPAGLSHLPYTPVSQVSLYFLFQTSPPQPPSCLSLFPG